VHHNGADGAAASYPDHAGADGAAASSCARSSSANFGLPPPVFVLPPPSPSVLAILSFLRLLAVSVPDILVLVRILLGFSVIYLTPLFLRVHFVPIRLPLLILYWYASSPLLYILRVSFINVSAAGVITSNSAVLLSISAVDNSTPSDTILTYSSASALRLLLLLGLLLSLQILPHSLIHALRLIGSFLLLLIILSQFLLQVLDKLLSMLLNMTNARSNIRCFYYKLRVLYLLSLLLIFRCLMY
jgi:hypothetical protein